MKNGDVMDFLNRMDGNGWTILLGQWGYYLQNIWEPNPDRYHIQIQKWRAHTVDHQYLIDDLDANGCAKDYSYIDLPEFPSYREALQDFLKRKIWEDNTKTFWEVQEDREWLD